MKYWAVLLASSVLEAVWATALGESDGFTRIVPIVIFALALTGSMLGLGYAMKGLPVSVAYAVWTGVGAALTVSWAILTGAEAASTLKVVFLAGIVACVVGLALVTPARPKRAMPTAATSADSDADAGQP
ncbi:multidrug efflux SMR transporter [Microbacterium sp. MPKO10]|uniref:DMT family transporter n=1 Tax=Microbacterium sp. MPKO10 TaxID=2989818 RepID=UPI002236707D|nr:multidrug efflux SMR transporter [Microbacterium sp. MPKO10]MCW4459182.1 multidrug efflux SMR transporter [Microbacterium sp. MPKO10]